MDSWTRPQIPSASSGIDCWKSGEECSRPCNGSLPVEGSGWTFTIPGNRQFKGTGLSKLVLSNPKCAFVGLPVQGIASIQKLVEFGDPHNITIVLNYYIIYMIKDVSSMWLFRTTISADQEFIWFIPYKTDPPGFHWMGCPLEFHKPLKKLR